jgi:DNA replication protein DnaC
MSPNCTKCNDLGFVYPLKDDGKVDWSRVVPCICQAERIEHEAKERLLRYCELPDHSENLNLDSYLPGDQPTLQNALLAAKSLLPRSTELQWLTLVGGRDLGKSHLAVGVCREWLSRGVPAKYVLVPRMLAWLKESFEKEQKGEGLSFSSRLRILSEVPLLVLDDLATENPTKWAMEQIMMIVDYRYANHLPLMVTTNKDIESLPGDDAGRIGSRLKRYIPSMVIFMEGSEYYDRINK